MLKDSNEALSTGHVRVVLVCWMHYRRRDDRPCMHRNNSSSHQCTCISTHRGRTTPRPPGAAGLQWLCDASSSIRGYAVSEHWIKPRSTIITHGKQSLELCLRYTHALYIHTCTSARHIKTHVYRSSTIAFYIEWLSNLGPKYKDLTFGTFRKRRKKSMFHLKSYLHESRDRSRQCGQWAFG